MYCVFLQGCRKNTEVKKSLKVSALKTGWCKTKVQYCFYSSETKSKEKHMVYNQFQKWPERYGIKLSPTFLSAQLSDVLPGVGLAKLLRQMTVWVRTSPSGLRASREPWWLKTSGSVGDTSLSPTLAKNTHPQIPFNSGKSPKPWVWSCSER